MLIGAAFLHKNMNFQKFVFSKSIIFPILLVGSTFIQSCESEPTAKLTVDLSVNECSTQYQTDIVTGDGIGAAVTDLATLDRVSSEITQTLGCGIDELEYSFNVSPVVAKIEFQIGEDEVTAFVPMEKGVTAPSPFVDGDIALKSINVRVDFPSANPAPLVGSYLN